jgi:ribonuclease BN (tRNA processing enzyme)
MPADTIQLFVAGAGPAYSDRPGSLGSSYVVRTANGPGVVLDLGQGTFPNLFRVGRPERFGAVIISHLHPDHFVDLIALRHYLRWERDGAVAVPVIAPRGLPERLDAVSGERGFAAGVLEVRALEPGDVPLDGTGLRVEAGRVTHRGDSFAFRVSRPEGGIGLVYSGDCGDASDLEPLIRPGDTLLTEVSFGTGPSPVADLHLDATAVGDLAARTGVGRLLLTHLQMGYAPDATVAAVSERFDGSVTLVRPGDDVTVGAA